MKSFLQIVVLLICLSSVSCKKAIENKQRDILIDAITNGEWQVHKFIEENVDVTFQFYGYRFKFEEQGTVQARFFGSTADGTWAGDVNNYTITSEFPGAGDPLIKLNGIWKLTDSYWDYVEAERITATGKNILHLIKKP